MKNSFRMFDNFILRTPLFPYDRLNLKSNINRPLFNEAILLSSPDLYNRRKQAAESPYINPKIEQSLYKYLSRASTRCTPFGLFAGCSVGQFGGDNEPGITIADTTSCECVIRLDMDYICALIQHIESIAEIRLRLKYYPNDSIYYLGGKLRYIEYYFKGTHRVYRLSSVDPDDYLKCILDLAVQGRSIDEIVSFLVKQNVLKSEARGYVEELISSQLLKSELELSITGNDALEKLLSQIRGIEEAANITGKLDWISAWLRNINYSKLDGSTDKYDSIIDIIREIGVSFEPKHLFQTDLYKPTKSGNIPSHLKRDLSSLISFLSGIRPIQPRTIMSEFRRAFYERYQDREVPLLVVLDSELGIGFGQNSLLDETNDLLKDVLYKVKPSDSHPILKPEMESILLKKYIGSIRNGDNQIILDDSDLGEVDIDLTDLPATMYMVCSIAEKSIHVKYVGGSCGANLIGRFCHLDTSIEEFSKEIVDMDQKLNSEVILAEIVHLPQSRAGNILFRPILRNYEIHYLAKPAVDDDFKIPVSDLMVSIRNGRIVLRSARLNKNIVPRLTTAHNYGFNSLPVYHFLCELQTQDIRSNLFFSWDGLFSGLDFKPRVKYKNFILARARWLITEDSFPKTNEKVGQHISERNIPETVIIAEGDMEQYVDFKSDEGIDLLRNILKRNKIVWAEEFLFSEENFYVKDTSGNSYCNEFIFVCHNSR